MDASQKQDSMKEYTTKQKLLHAAKKLFAKYNYDFVSTRMLAGEAGVGQSAIFFHYGSKEGLATAVVEDIVHYHEHYYKDLYERVMKAYEYGSVGPGAAKDFLMEYISVQIDITQTPSNRRVLSYFANANSLPEEVVKPIFELTKSQVEVPMSKLLCAYKGSDNMNEAFVVIHSIITSIIAYRMTYVPNLYGKEFDIASQDEKIAFLKDMYSKWLDAVEI